VSRLHLQDIPLVLTASIVPNGVQSARSDWRVRRMEYLAAVDYYRQFTLLYLLENSRYDLLGDREFTSREGVLLRKLPLSQTAERGKGFQEFELLDRWFQEEQVRPPRWLKITGRYVYQNIGRVLHEVARERTARMVVDQYRRSRQARTGIFAVESSFYERVIRGMYHECDDATGEWAEVVLFRRLARFGGEVRLFRVEPGLRGVSGSTGRDMWHGVWHYRLKVAARAVNRLIDRRYLWFGV
jgi:hypothetical protein